MTIIKKVLFHQQFAEGRVDKPTATDLAIMSDAEVERLFLWLADIVEGKSHEGANKPSWMSTNGFIPGTELYRDNKIWHYHCGPYRKAGSARTDATLAANYDGRHSGPVYHYSKQADTIIVLGYSRIHNPFPIPTSKRNPLGERGPSWMNNIEVPGLEPSLDSEQ